MNTVRVSISPIFSFAECLWFLDRNRDESLHTIEDGTQLRHEGKIHYLFPTPELLANDLAKDLRAMQFSSMKASYIVGVAKAFKDGTISNEGIASRLPRCLPFAVSLPQAVPAWLVACVARFFFQREKHTVHRAQPLARSTGQRAVNLLISVPSQFHCTFQNKRTQTFCSCIFGVTQVAMTYHYQAASWKIMPRVWRLPLCTSLTPCFICTR